jgi:hypothetical protein
LAASGKDVVKRSPIYRWAHATALLAVALFSFAYAQATVMQAAGDRPGTTMVPCPEMGMMQVDADHGVPAGKSQKACPFCAAASHAPLCSQVAPIPQSVAAAWTAYASLRPLGPRGPPAREPKARGPPTPILTT